MTTEIIYDFRFNKLLALSDKAFSEAQRRLVYEAQSVAKAAKHSRRAKAAGSRYTIRCHRLIERKDWFFFVDEIKVERKEYSVGVTIIAHKVSDANGNRFVLFIKPQCEDYSDRKVEEREARVDFLSYHLLRRYAERKMNRPEAAINEIIEEIGWAYVDGRQLLSTGEPYGGNEKNICVMLEMPEGLALGYQDYKRGVVFADTYIYKTMFDDFQQKVYNNFLVRKDKFGVRAVVKETPEGLREMTEEELAEMEKERSTEEWKEFRDKKIAEMIKENRKRWKKKAMRGADSVKAVLGNKK